MTYTLSNMYAKNLCKRTLLVQLIIKNVVTCFLEHSVGGCDDALYKRLMAIIDTWSLIQLTGLAIHYCKKAARPSSKFAGYDGFRRYKIAQSKCRCDGDSGISFSFGRIDWLPDKCEECCQEDKRYFVTTWEECVYIYFIFICIHHTPVEKKHNITQ